MTMVQLGCLAAPGLRLNRLNRQYVEFANAMRRNQAPILGPLKTGSRQERGIAIQLRRRVFIYDASRRGDCERLRLPGFVLATCMLSGMFGCMYPRVSYSNPGLRAQFEQDFAARELDPIEGFWHSENEYAEGTGVIYGIDPSSNHGFPFAARALSAEQKVALPYRIRDLERIMARYKPSTAPNVYHGQVLMVRGTQEYWVNATVTLVDPTTADVTVRTDSPVLGGSTQRGYFVGPQRELEARLERMARARQTTTAPAGVSSGSGFLVNRRLVVTNYHVISDAKKISCFFGDVALGARAISLDRSNDLALLLLDEPLPSAATTLNFGDADRVRQGQTVFALGFPLSDILGKGVRLHEGIISSLTGFHESSAQFQVEMSVHPGNSGGPLLDARGAVIGIITSKLGLSHLLKEGDFPEGIAFAVKASLVRPLAAAAGMLDELQNAPRSAATMTPEEITSLCRTAVVRIESER